MKPVVLFGCLLSVLWLSSAHAFDLFDPERGQEKTPQPEPQPVAPPPVNTPPPPPPPKPKGPQQDFTLIGTSQIGDKYSAILQAPDGKTFVQSFPKEGRTPIDGYPNYYLLSVGSRQVQIEYPGDAPCQTSKMQKGVNCYSGGAKARLDLVRKGAIDIPPPPPPPPSEGDTTNQNPLAALLQPNQPVELSPEEQQRREEELERRREIYKNFKRQVIKEEDVPPGMRVVRTPFGDRLVPDKR